nr:hypothetical protein [Bacteroidota bacterium]
TSNTSNIKIDARSQIPPNRLNDGNLDSKLSKSSNVQQGNTGTIGEQAPAQTTQTIEGGQVDSQENLQEDPSQDPIQVPLQEVD